MRTSGCFFGLMVHKDDHLCTGCQARIERKEFVDGFVNVYTGFGSVIGQCKQCTVNTYSFFRGWDFVHEGKSNKQNALMALE